MLSPGHGNRIHVHNSLTMMCVLSSVTKSRYYGLFDICNHICSFLHVNVTYSRYLETFKWQNVVYTLHGVCSTLHQYLSEEQGARKTMKTPGIYIGALAVCCIVALVIGTASAAAMMQQGSGNNLNNKAGPFGPEKMIERLEQQGVDVTGVKTALQNGDTNAVKAWVQSYREAHLGERVKGAGKGPVTGEANGVRMLRMLDNLTAQGYDVLTIRTAVTSGNYETAHTLMQEFRTAHPDVFPARIEGAGKGRLGGQRGFKNNQ